jgi:hypothetical protein
VNMHSIKDGDVLEPDVLIRNILPVTDRRVATLGSNHSSSCQTQARHPRLCHATCSRLHANGVREHGDELMEGWQLCRKRQPPKTIERLR